jgi:hypothetical protein
MQLIKGCCAKRMDCVVYTRLAEQDRLAALLESGPDRYCGQQEGQRKLRRARATDAELSLHVLPGPSGLEF